MEISDSMIKKICSSMIYKRGIEYFREGRVHMRKRSDTELTAVVDDEELYNVSITFDGGNIKDTYCTCQYFETMQSPCKHIVATLKQRQLELEKGGSYTDENDRLAAALCAEFVSEKQPETIRAAFTLCIHSGKNGERSFSVTVEFPEHGGGVNGLENFLDAYLKGTDIKLDRNTVYNRKTMVFPKTEDDVIALLAEVHETRSADSSPYTASQRRTEFGSETARRLLPLLAKLDFRLVCDGITINDARIVEEDPDILIDIEAYGREIILSVSERGFAVTSDGEWFLHRDIVYRTSPEWRRIYMPIYRALSSEGRTQISFKGDNAMLFAAHVLPELRDRHGVVISGLDELVVNEEPRFEVCLDAAAGGITASAAVRYGTIVFRLPSEPAQEGEKIVVRDTEKENKFLSLFEGLERVRSAFYLSGDRKIYDFLKNTVPELSKHAKVIMTDRFGKFKVRRDVALSARLSYRSDIDFLEMDFETELSPEELKGVLSAIRLKYDFYRLSDGGFIDLKDNKNTELMHLLERLDLTNEDVDSRSKLLPKYDLMYLGNAQFIEKDGSVTDYMEKIRAIEPVIPAELETVLRPYQREGVKWLTQLTAMGLGGILADDMGLGKTLQVIAYIHGVKPDKPVLIVAPSTLTYNWQKEIEKFTPGVGSLIINGPAQVRHELIKTVNEYEFVITSYPLLRRDTALYKNIEFSYCFIDEAQYIKNPKTMNAVSVKRINARRKFALTGTPIENSLMELWSIFDFVMPGYLKSSREFRNRFELPAVRENGGAATDMLRAMIKPFVLRRMKKDVLSELPEKIETTIYADLTKEQKAVYAEYLSSARGEARSILESRGNRFMILTLLLRLRQICCHPLLFNSSYSFGSGKLDLLMELVSNSREAGHRILVFSQFRAMLDIIGAALEKAGIGYFYINGSTPVEERTDMAERYNNGERDVFLVSLKAGGTGLNLIGADTVIHYDPWWNPAVTDQATDRAYRIGQTRAVNVIKLAARGSIEEKILKLQENKRMLADDVIRVNKDALAGLSDEEIMSLFDI